MVARLHWSTAGDFAGVVEGAGTAAAAFAVGGTHSGTSRPSRAAAFACAISPDVNGSVPLIAAGVPELVAPVMTLNKSGRTGLLTANFSWARALAVAVSTRPSVQTMR